MGERIDKFCWCIRLTKTRSIATEFVKKGKILLHNEVVKPAKEITKGDIISIKKGNAIFTYKVKEVLKNRVNTKLVNEYIEDITPPSEIEKYETYTLSQKQYKNYGKGKPSKKERRAIDELFNT